MTNQTRVLVTGAGGFIGHHLVSDLVERGYWVRGVDIKRPEYEDTRAHEFEILADRRQQLGVGARRHLDAIEPRQGIALHDRGRERAGAGGSQAGAVARNDVGATRGIRDHESRRRCG